MHTLVTMLMRTAGWFKGLRWRTRNGWPLIEGGRGEPVLVLVHGFAVDSGAMFSLACRLAKNHRVLALDLPGFGEHAIDDPSIVDLDWFVAALGGFLENEQLDNVVLVGASMGGAICATFAAEHPNRVLGCCLISPAGIEPPILDEILIQAKAGENGFRMDTVEDFEHMMGLNFASPPKLPRFIKQGLAARAIELADQHETILRSMGETLLSGAEVRLPAIRCPVSIVWGERDEIMNVSAAPKWVDAISDVELTLLPEIGHSAQMEAPRSVEVAIERLLERISQA